MTEQIKIVATKQNFWRQMRSALGDGDWTCMPYDESMPDGNGGLKISHMVLYYKNGKHVGTWSKGRGWHYRAA